MEDSRLFGTRGLARAYLSNEVAKHKSPLMYAGVRKVEAWTQRVRKWQRAI